MLLGSLVHLASPVRAAKIQQVQRIRGEWGSMGWNLERFLEAC